MGRLYLGGDRGDLQELPGAELEVPPELEEEAGSAWHRAEHRHCLRFSAPERDLG